MKALTTTMEDPTESARKERIEELAAFARCRGELERDHGKVWSTDELRNDFEVIGFLAPFVMVRRKSDRQEGTLEFQHWPRLYFNWVSD
jgi:hypothetical protein